MRTPNQRRFLAGACLIAAPLTLMAAIAISPSLSGKTAEVLPKFAANKASLLVADLLFTAAIVLLVPATLGLVRQLRPRAPRLAPIAAGLLFVGWMFVLGPVFTDRVQVQLATSGISLPQAVSLSDRITGDTAVGVMFAVFVVGHTLGGILTGVVLLRTRFVPVIAAAATTAGAVLHPIARVGLESKPLDVIAFVLLSTGLVAAGRRVLAMSDEVWAAGEWVGGAAPAGTAGTERVAATGTGV